MLAGPNMNRGGLMKKLITIQIITVRGISEIQVERHGQVAQIISGIRMSLPLGFGVSVKENEDSTMFEVGVFKETK